MIISSSSGALRADEVELPYIAFMELFRYEILNLYSKLQNCTLIEAENVWKIFVDYYSLIYGVSLNASIESVSLSEDGRVCKLKTRGFCAVEKQFNGEMKLNRILPS